MRHHERHVVANVGNFLLHPPGLLALIVLLVQILIAVVMWSLPIVIAMIGCSIAGGILGWCIKRGGIRHG